jgi:hypothetical protein
MCISLLESLVPRRTKDQDRQLFHEAWASVEAKIVQERILCVRTGLSPHVKDAMDINNLLLGQLSVRVWNQVESQLSKPQLSDRRATCRVPNRGQNTCKRERDNAGRMPSVGRWYHGLSTHEQVPKKANPAAPGYEYYKTSWTHWPRGSQDAPLVG